MKNKNEIKTQTVSPSRLINFVNSRLYKLPGIRRIVMNQFHSLFYYSDDLLTWKNTYWHNVRVLKCPFDLWVYQEIVCELKPNMIIESGTYQGGSALFLATVCASLNKGRVITIDNTIYSNRPQHERIEYLLGSSTSLEVVETIRSRIRKDDRVMVILDADHHKEHVLNELRLYSEFVTIGSYMIVEDSNINGHPVLPGYGPGPMEAIDGFLVENDCFSIDRSREKFYLTFNPKGYLIKLR